jgi:hypothetical protein
MTGEIEPRYETPSDVVAYLKREMAQREIPEGTKIEFHYHAAPAQAPAQAPDTRPAGDPMAPAARLAPYFVILLGGAIILAMIAVITIMLVPAIMALATSIMVFMIGFAFVAVALAASIRSLRYSKHDVKRSKR